MSDPNYDPSEGEKQERSDAGVGGEVYREDESTLGTTPHAGDMQDAPTMDMHPTTSRAQIEGIVEQSRADVGGGDSAELERVIRQRLGQAKIDLDDAEIRELAGS